MMLGVVVNSFNRRALLENALDSLFRILPQAGEDWVVVVFDAGSTDGSLPFLQEREAQLKGKLVVVTPAPGEDRSFGAGINVGAQAALQHLPQIKWLILFETDNFAESFAPFAVAITLMQQQPEVAAVGFTGRKYAGGFAGYAASFPTWTDFALGPNLGGILRVDEPKLEWTKVPGGEWSYCDVAFSSPIIIRAEAWRESQGFDAVTFPFSEIDIDWAWRLRQAGQRQGLVKTDEVFHDNKEQISGWSQTRVFHLHQGKYRVLSRHCPGGQLLIKPFLFLRHVLELGAVVLLRRKSPHFRALLQQRVRLLKRCWHGYAGSAR